MAIFDVLKDGDIFRFQGRWYIFHGKEYITLDNKIIVRNLKNSPPVENHWYDKYSLLNTTENAQWYNLYRDFNHIRFPNIAIKRVSLNDEALVFGRDWFYTEHVVILRKQVMRPGQKVHIERVIVVEGQYQLDMRTYFSAGFPWKDKREADRICFQNAEPHEQQMLERDVSIVDILLDNLQE